MGIEEKRAIVERLDRLKEEISFLERERPSTGETLVADDKLRRSLERSLEIALEAVLDIARLIIIKKLFTALHRTADLKKFANYITKDL